MKTISDSTKKKIYSVFFVVMFMLVFLMSSTPLIPYGLNYMLEFEPISGQKTDFTMQMFHEDGSKAEEEDIYAEKIGEAEYYISKPYIKEDGNGYKTMMVQYFVDTRAMAHMSDYSDAAPAAICNLLTPFDYYTGTVFSCDIGEDGSKTTKVKWGKREYDVTVNTQCKPETVFKTEEYKNTDKGFFQVPFVSHYDFRISITYPDDYDGLRFALSKTAPADNPENEVKEDTETILDNARMSDMIFFLPELMQPDQTQPDQTQPGQIQSEQTQAEKIKESIF